MTGACRRQNRLGSIQKMDPLLVTILNIVAKRPSFCTWLVTRKDILCTLSSKNNEIADFESVKEPSKDSMKSNHFDTDTI